MTDNIIELINRVALAKLLPTKAQNSLKLFYFISSIKWLGKFDIQTFLPRKWQGESFYSWGGVEEDTAGRLRRTPSLELSEKKIF